MHGAISVRNWDLYTELYTVSMLPSCEALSLVYSRVESTVARSIYGSVGHVQIYKFITAVIFTRLLANICSQVERSIPRTLSVKKKTHATSFITTISVKQNKIMCKCAYGSIVLVVSDGVD